ncbi:hypothetical protein L873DRAFT_1805098, partial [Choiromyces venosus 120613-1]
LTPRDAPIHPEIVIKEDVIDEVFHLEICIVIKEDYPITAFPPAATCEVSRTNGAHSVWTLLGFNIPAFSDSESAPLTGAPGIIGLPELVAGTFQTSASGAGPATVVEDFGLSFDCPTAPTCYGYEVQPVGGGDKVTRGCAGHGFIITAAAPQEHFLLNMG